MSRVPPLTARVATIAELFAEEHLAPAAVQREYKWEEVHCRQLLDDIDRVFVASTGEEGIITATATGEDQPLLVDVELPELVHDELPLMDYHLGAVVFHRRAEGSVEIFDGLQRLTTLTVLLCVIRDITTSPGLADELDNLVNLSGGRPRLVLAGKDKTLAIEIQKRGEAAKARRTQPRTVQARRLRTAVRVFRTEVASWSEYRRGRFADFLLEGVSFGVTEAADQRLARQIFVTTNARGMPLDQVDIFKGQLADIAEETAAADEILRHWTGIQARVGDGLRDLLLAVDFIERRKPQGPDALAALAQYLAERKTGDQVLAWTRKLAMYAGAWDELTRKLQTPGEGEIDTNIWRLGLFRWREWRPLALLWYMDEFQRQAARGQPSQSAIHARRFAGLHQRCMAITLAGYSESDRSTIFGRAIQEASNKRDPLTGALRFNVAAQDRMRAALRIPQLNHEVRVTLIRWLESMLWRGQPVPQHVAKATVEHVLPQRPAANSQWILDHPSDEDRFVLCHLLGNLVPLDASVNFAIENRDFSEKLTAFRAAGGQFKLLDDVVAHEAWTAPVILQRTERLAEMILRELELPPWA